MKTKAAQRAYRALGDQLGETKVVSSGPAYEKARCIWNAAVTFRPEIIVFCESRSDVQVGVLAASVHGLSLSVRSGGHDWAGRSIWGELVLDLTRMREVALDGLVATVAGGATSTDVAEAVCVAGLTAVTGIIGSVGVAGLALGGGYGHFTAKFGMALDNILGAEVVLADGRVMQVDATHEPDLFWALRGGGGNFGVVTSLRLQLHPVSEVQDGVVAFSWDQAKDVLKAYNLLIAAIPDDLTLMPTFFASPDGKLSLLLHYAWCGKKGESQRMLEKVKDLGKPIMVQVGSKTLAEILNEAEKRTMEGVCWIVRTITLAALEPAAVEVILNAMENRSSPLSWIASHPFYGAGERIAPEATAFGIRQRHFMVGIYTAWRSGEEAVHRKWADDVEAALKPFAMASSYPNYFGIDRPEQTAQAYGQNTDRLLQVKERYDPRHVFNAISLPLHSRIKSK
jgi:FAD/FMN-containing dehydrogenase